MMHTLESDSQAHRQKCPQPLKRFVESLVFDEIFRYRRWPATEHSRAATETGFGSSCSPRFRGPEHLGAELTPPQVSKPAVSNSICKVAS